MVYKCPNEKLLKAMLIVCIGICNSLAAPAQNTKPVISTGLFSINFSTAPGFLWTYTLQNTPGPVYIKAPVFEIDNKTIECGVKNFKPVAIEKLSNGTTAQTFSGIVTADTSLQLLITFRWAATNPVVRFKYRLLSNKSHLLTKKSGKDNLKYFTASFAANTNTTEIRLSDFDEKVHANHISETPVEERYFENEASVMGPILVSGNEKQTMLLAYEHGSQYPDKFIEFQLKKNHDVTVAACKGNYLDNEPLDALHPYETIWLELAAVKGNTDAMASQYRSFVLNYMSAQSESRKPYIFYNTWGRQERTKWAGGKYLTSMNLSTTLQEIEVAHQMGIEVYVIDAGWFLKTGDWQVNTAFFPDTLKQVKALLNKYQMKLGLWFNPLSASISSDMLKKNRSNLLTLNGVAEPPAPIWETEESVKLSLVSPYWEDFANKLIALSKELGVTYFKWDAVGQYGGNNAGLFNGTEKNSLQERTESYAFQLPIFMSKVVDKLCKACPESIVDFDITEEGRSVGLSFLSSGKYFTINNGPYFHNYDLATVWKSPLPDSNANIFVHPGPARGWFTRAVLVNDKWIPSILFLTHYQPDGSPNSQLINIASLILGQNGIWGEILKTTPDGVQLFQHILGKYKMVRNDITISNPVQTGSPGRSPEVYEKINVANGKGAVAVFANMPGTYTYITKNKVAKKNWHTTGVQVAYDAKGRAIVKMDFKESSAKILFFGVE